ncbi:Concanavalin A-like lectin/glucanase domain containing protein [Rhypophila decipiens]
MAPSFAKLGAAAVACAVSVAAADQHIYKLSDSYNADNFFSKFNFFTDPDPTNGFVQYQSEEEATRLGLIAKQGEEIFIGVDHSSSGPEVDGRKSVRIESKDKLDTGLIIGKFTHFPKPVCGAWPAFWTFGDVWPTDGEIDIYEMWNLASHNLLTYHTGAPDEVGECHAKSENFLGDLKTPNCDNFADGQYAGQGCGATELNGQWGSSTGGVYATDIQPEGVRVWSWPRDREPQDIKDGKPDPTSWGKPHFAVESDDCDITRAFRKQKIVLNVAFCGGATESNWNQQCSIITKGSTCVDWVRNNPDAFADVFWKISYIDIYQREKAAPSSSSDCSDEPEETETVTATASEEVPVSTGYPVETSAAAPVSESTSCSESETATVTEAPVSETSSCTDTETVTATETEAPASETTSCSETETETATVTETESEVPVSTTAAPETTEYATSTVYSTSTYTVTSCSTTVTDCPHNGGSYTKTEIIPVSTTICPVEKTTGGPIVPVTTTTAEDEYETTTATTTLQLTTTVDYLPEESTSVPAPAGVPSGKPYVPIPGAPSAPAFPYPGVNSTLSTLAPKPTGGLGYSASRPVYVPTAPVTTPEQVQETAPVTAGANKGRAGALVMAVAGFAALLL